MLSTLLLLERLLSRLLLILKLPLLLWRSFPGLLLWLLSMLLLCSFAELLLLLLLSLLLLTLTAVPPSDVVPLLPVAASGMGCLVMGGIRILSFGHWIL
jgi:hypothetical protein